ncbi:outer membrane receptor for ferrienterochelin and colicin [Mucilaginibacter yixingensis]|uniref:Outer membrane receptor for ferrienterochelin and colicin n=1 Tax=Mucilaginibacter yixingensis TaxID=1295612 RepID=A0A2T5JEK8_9SPHI|nr:outer membrane beta-barrel family protein [Mucilaginibacter yixingensis]PTR00867.1 outer membrane receptor for ferrienterochelin and colicin [Mucilaginibacter yixingensis]
MRKTIFTILCALLSTLAIAQTPALPKTMLIKGTVIDSASGKSLSFVTAALTDATTKAPVKSTLTKESGLFELKNLPMKAYHLSLVYTGYKTHPISIKGDKEVEDVGKIVLAPSNNQLKEVAVTASKPLATQEIDRLSYDIQADPESKVLNVLEMMRKVPMLSLDADDNIKLKGSGNYKIFINGKPSSMLAHNPKDVLRAMPATSIQKIEVITTPPAKYDSEGLDGIINIITNKNVDNGYNASLNFRQNFPIGGPGGGGSFTGKKGKFGISTYMGGNIYNTPEVAGSSSRITSGSNPSVLTQNSINSYKNKGVYGNAELSFEADSLNLFTVEFGLYTGNYTGLNSNRSFTQVAPANIGYTFNNTNLDKYNSYDLGLNYQLGFKGNKNRLLTFSYRSINGIDKGSNNQLLGDTINYHASSFLQINNANSHEHTLQVDYVHPLKKINIEGGMKAILRNNNSNFEYDVQDAKTNTYNIDTARSNVYDNNQYVLGAYNTYQYTLKSWAFKAGARAEETIVKADFITNATNVNRNYFNVVPSVSINRKFKNNSSLNLGYTQRIQRPDIWQLNPFVDLSNPAFQFHGNPDLKAVVSNNFQLNYSWFKKATINVGLSYNFASNTIEAVSVYDTVSRVTTTSYANIGKNRSIGTNFSVNYPITKKLTFNLNGNLKYLFIQGMVNGVLAKNDGLQGNVYSYLSYKFADGTRVNANVGYASSYISLQGQSSSFVNSGLSISRDLIKNKLILGGVVNNPFAKFRTYRNETTGPLFVQTSERQSYLRSFSFNLSYRFGKLQKEIKKNQRSINNDDTSGGKGGGN